MSKKKKDISEAVTLESMDENIVVADTEAEGEPSVSEEKEEKKKKHKEKNGGSDGSSGRRSVSE